MAKNIDEKDLSKVSGGRKTSDFNITLGNQISLYNLMHYVSYKDTVILVQFKNGEEVLGRFKKASNETANNLTLTIENYLLEPIEIKDYVVTNEDTVWQVTSTIVFPTDGYRILA